MALWKSHSFQRDTKSHLEKQSQLMTQLPPVMTLHKSQQNIQSHLKSNLLFHLKYTLQRDFKMSRFKLRTGRLLLIAICWYQSTNRKLIHSHTFSYILIRVVWPSIGLMIKPPLLRMYQQIWKLNRKLDLTKITSKISGKIWNNN